MQRFLFLLSFIFFSTSYAQQKELSGKIIDNTTSIPNAHILNLTTQKGTFTNKNGDFLILANLNDVIQISSISHEVHKFTVSKSNLDTKKILIELKVKNNLLDEVIIKSTQLTGNLLSDIQKTPRNYGDELSQQINLKYKELAKHIKIPSNYGLSFSLGRNTGKKRLQKRKQLDEKIEFPNKLIAHFGSYFFTEELKIPNDKIHNFIDYCMFKNVLYLYKTKQLFELTRVLQQESITYLALNTLTK